MIPRPTFLYMILCALLAVMFTPPASAAPFEMSLGIQWRANYEETSPNWTGLRYQFERRVDGTVKRWRPPVRRRDSGDIVLAHFDDAFTVAGVGSEISYRLRADAIQVGGEKDGERSISDWTPWVSTTAQENDKPEENDAPGSVRRLTID